MNKRRTLFCTLVLTIIFSASAFGQANVKPEKKPEKKPFNAKLAEKLGADEHGMKAYVMVILKTGPQDAKITDKDARAKLFKGHFDNMQRLADEGKLAFAGPFIDGKPRRGLFIFSVKTLEEAEALVKTDPTVKSGLFVYEMTKLYGSAALMKVRDIHETIKKSDL